MYKAHLKENHPAFYQTLLLSGRLGTHLAELDRQAQKRFDTIVEQMKESEGITEDLKVKDQVEWVQKINSIRNYAEELVKYELIY